MVTLLATPLITVLALALPAPWQDPATRILSEHCVRCHGGEKVKSGLDLTTRERLLQGATMVPRSSSATPRPAG
ncbi:MAG: c-type cytochrome domain-containing protein [Planctomycetota bacterium]